MRSPAFAASEAPQRLQVVEKFFNRAIRRQHLRQLVLPLRQRVGHHRQCVAPCLPVLFQRALDARLHADDESPVIFELILRAKYLRLRRVHLRDIGVEPLRSSSLTGRCCALVVSRSMMSSSRAW